MLGHKKSVFSKSHANLTLKNLTVHVSCHNQSSSSVREKNADAVSTLRDFCKLFGVFLTILSSVPLGILGFVCTAYNLHHVKIPYLFLNPSGTELIFRH